MANRVDLNVHPFGLGGGTVVSGSWSGSGDWFQYTPLKVSAAILSMASSMISGSSINETFTAGISVVGPIISVTQSSGLAILYNGVTPVPYLY